MLWWHIIQSVIEGCYPMENDWSGTLQNNNIICIFTQKIKLFQLNKYDHYDLIQNYGVTYRSGS